MGSPADDNRALIPYLRLLDRCWQVLTPTLGTITVATIFQRALLHTQSQYPCLQVLRADETGISLVNDTAAIAPQDAARAGAALLGNLTEIVDSLAPPFLVQALQRELQDLQTAGAIEP